jgi:DNA-directed RNA polymerase-3 subunit RPC5
MRPQFHHIDAQSEVDKGRSRREQPTGERSAQPHAIHMSVKATADGEEETTDTMAERIRAVQEEQWRKFEYVDEDSSEAWEAFDHHLFVGDIEGVPKLASSMSATEYLDTISAPRAPEKLVKLSRLLKKT